MEKTHGQLLLVRRIAQLDPEKDADLIRQLSSEVLICGFVQGEMPTLESRPLTEEEKIFAGHTPALFQE